MKKLSTLLTFTALAIAAFTTVASAALPSILLLSGTEATTTAESATAKTEFHGPVVLKGTGYKLEFTTKEPMTSLGKALIWLRGSTINGTACNSPGDTAGNVLGPVEWHTVLAFSGGGAKLFLLLILFNPPLDVDCGAILLVLGGSMLLDVEEFGKDATSFTATTGKCTGTTPAFKTYSNDEGKETAAKLSVEVSEIKSTACEEFNEGGTIAFTASSMLEVMEP
jgi:hypothetical protein